MERLYIILVGKNFGCPTRPEIYTPGLVLVIVTLDIIAQRRNIFNYQLFDHFYSNYAFLKSASIMLCALWHCQCSYVF